MKHVLSITTILFAMSVSTISFTKEAKEYISPLAHFSLSQLEARKTTIKRVRLAYITAKESVCTAAALTFERKHTRYNCENNSIANNIEAEIATTELLINEYEEAIVLNTPIDLKQIN